MARSTIRGAGLDFAALPSQPGTYVLVLACRAPRTIRIGNLGMLRLQRGFYLYVGSAFGPGGLAARVGHHRRPAVRPHWHIDYLGVECRLVEVWFSIERTRLEHTWAAAIHRMSGMTVPLPRFGSSDCACPAHLFRCTAEPSFRTFVALHAAGSFDAPM